MGRTFTGSERAATSVVGTVYLVGIVVVLAGTASVFVLGFGSPATEAAPQVTVSHATVEHGGDPLVAVTLEAGDSVRADRLYVVASDPVDIGGGPGSGVVANDDPGWTSERERFDESSDGDPQVGVGETWDAGETAYLDPAGALEGLTVGIYWTDDAVEGVNPGTVEGENTYKIAKFTV
jgi:FlaG/FlaF family flagellin (archaellin)